MSVFKQVQRLIDRYESVLHSPRFPGFRIAERYIKPIRNLLLRNRQKWHDMADEYDLGDGSRAYEILEYAFIKLYKK